ncbi:DNA-directed RNA polymerase core subunit rpc40 [Thecaphora frezii]
MPRATKAASKKAVAAAAAADEPMDVDAPSTSTSSQSDTQASILAASSSSAPVNPRRLVEILPERVGSVAATDFPLHHPGEDHTWSHAKFADNLRLIITRLSDAQVEFDLIGVDASIANAIRRVLMAEVPTVAIEHVYVWNNTSIIQDEVLSHRLGLVPLKIDPDRIAMRMPGDDADDSNTVVFYLKAKCERNPRAPKGETDPDKLYIGHNGTSFQPAPLPFMSPLGTLCHCAVVAPTHPFLLFRSRGLASLLFLRLCWAVYSDQLKWDPKGSQEEDFADCPPRAVHDRILLAKLRPGQELDLELHCEKGIGKDHAKFSPVATATYRLLPHIQLLKPIPSHLAAKFASCFPEGVVGVRGPKGQEEAFVQDARKDTMSREVLRYPEFEGYVKLGRVRDHFLFDLESSGVIAPEKLLPVAIRTLREKIRAVRESLDVLESTSAPAASH